jgi:hypothetical protein
MTRGVEMLMQISSEEAGRATQVEPQEECFLRLSVEAGILFALNEHELTQSFVGAR